MQIPVMRVRLDEQSRFGFSCGRCLRCCRDKLIQVNPYETARLASRLDISTTQFLERYTTGSGAYLRMLHNGQCCFLGPDGCSVHADRPLVCRLYPLSRHVSRIGDGWFSELEPQQRCGGRYSRETRISDYLADQEALAYMNAADRYLDMLWEMLECAEASSGNRPASAPQHQNQLLSDLLPGTLNWMDMDQLVSRYCRQKNLTPPADIGARMQLHLEALHELFKRGT